MRRFVIFCFVVWVPLSSGCLSVHSHYALLDENGALAIGQGVSPMMSVGLLLAVALGSAGLTATAFLAVRRWRSSRRMEDSPTPRRESEPAIASELAG